MWYHLKDREGEFFVSTLLSENYLDNIRTYVIDGQKPKRFSDIGNKNLICLNSFLVYNEENEEHYIRSVKDAISLLQNGEKVYAIGRYYSQSTEELGHKRWISFALGTKGWDPHFRDKDAEVIKIIQTKRFIKLVLKCRRKNADDSYRETYSFIVVQEHY